MRLILTKAREPVSFNDLLSFKSVSYETFREVCVKSGLLHEDEFLAMTFLEMTFFMASPLKVYNLFVDFVLNAPVTAIENSMKEPRTLNFQNSYPKGIHLVFIKKRFESFEKNYDHFNLPTPPVVCQKLLEPNVSMNKDIFGPENKPITSEQRRFF